MPVVVLEPLAGERRASGGGAHHEAAPARVAEGPDLVAGALEPEHRVEDVERHHRLGRVAYEVPAAWNEDIEPASVMPSSSSCPSAFSR